MSERQLRDLLRQAVPEAPELDPSAIGRRAQRDRRHRASAVAAAAVLAVGGSALGIAVLDDQSPAERPPSNTVSGPSLSEEPEDRPLSPYDVPPCSAQSPYVEPGDGAVTDVGNVVAVRMCPDFDPRTPGVQAPATPDQRAELEDADALVRDLAGFMQELRGLPSVLPAYCNRDGGSWIGQSFVFYRADGSRIDLPAVGCELATIEGRTVHGGALRELYLTALSRQRTTAHYTRPFDDELACDTAPRGGPVRPGRERLVAAVACDLPRDAESIPPNLEPVTLDDAQLAELNRAWARPGDPIVRGPSGEHQCVDVPRPPSFIVAATDRSDVLQLSDSPCGFLVWHGWEGHPGATVPTDLAELGLE